MDFRQLNRSRDSMAAVGVGGAVTLGAAAAAAAAIATADDVVINACYDKNGSLRIVASGESCRNNEQPLSWNQKGPQVRPVRTGKTALGPHRSRRRSGPRWSGRSRGSSRPRWTTRRSRVPWAAGSRR